MGTGGAEFFAARPASSLRLQPRCQRSPRPRGLDRGPGGDACHDALADHKAEFGYGPHDPVFATRRGTRNSVDNVRRRIVQPAVDRANALLAARGQRAIARCTPLTLRRTFASILAEVTSRRGGPCTCWATPTRR
jgi:hypothetical protein